MKLQGKFQSAPPRERGRLPPDKPLIQRRKNDLRREPRGLPGFRAVIHPMVSVKELIPSSLPLARTSGMDRGHPGFAPGFFSGPGRSQNQGPIGIVGLLRPVVFHTVLPVVAEKVKAQAIVGKVHFIQEALL